MSVKFRKTPAKNSVFIEVRKRLVLDLMKF